MNIDFSVEVKVNRFREIADTTHQKIDQVIRKTAFDIEARAKALCPVDTGALRASIYVCTGQQSTFGSARAAAASKNSQAKFAAEVKPDGTLEAIVAVSALYGVYVEFGSIRMAAHPFFGPALAAVKPKFEQAIAGVLAGA